MSNDIRRHHPFAVACRAAVGEGEEEMSDGNTPRYRVNRDGAIILDAQGDWVSYNTFKLRRNEWSAVVDAQITLIEELRSKLAEREKEPQK